jgi:hypothetical protein
MWRVGAATARAGGAVFSDGKMNIRISFRMITITRLRYAVLIADRDHLGASFVQCPFIRAGAG